jgi:1-deoxy-D-xylulose-5-phosphate synthase
MSDNNYQINIKRLGIPDTFVEHGTPEKLYNMLGLDSEGISKSIHEYIENSKIKKIIQFAV